ncbi:hypothetical protein R3P38DRAFT_2813471 [Favolaschia claudopus]|uniref:Uncharacterized protein n=1 Tax=Favolaschia claudopus TaxID=2862362 RepID=A0AAV9Z5E9_9AGAR
MYTVHGKLDAGIEIRRHCQSVPSTESALHHSGSGGLVLVSVATESSGVEFESELGVNSIALSGIELRLELTASSARRFPPATNPSTEMIHRSFPTQTDIRITASSPFGVGSDKRGSKLPQSVSRRPGLAENSDKAWVPAARAGPRSDKSKMGKIISPRRVGAAVMRRVCGGSSGRPKHTCIDGPGKESTLSWKLVLSQFYCMLDAAVMRWEAAVKRRPRRNM